MYVQIVVAIGRLSFQRRQAEDVTGAGFTGLKMSGPNGEF